MLPPPHTPTDLGQVECGQPVAPQQHHLLPCESRLSSLNHAVNLAHTQQAEPRQLLGTPVTLGHTASHQQCLVGRLARRYQIGQGRLWLLGGWVSGSRMRQDDKESGRDDDKEGGWVTACEQEAVAPDAAGVPVCKPAWA